MDLEGNLILDRKPAQRWVSTIAVVIPVVACIVGVTWFVRAFISPPTVAIPGPMVLATSPTPPPARPAREEPRAPEPPPAAQPYAYSLPMLATLSVAPPSTGAARPRVPAAFADPTRDSAAMMSPASETAAAPIEGPVPMPRPRPEMTAEVTAAVPLPRARPAEEEAASPLPNSEPVYNRHSAE